MGTRLLVIFIFFASVASSAVELLKPEDIIQKYGNLRMSDGSSYYVFFKDKRFESDPVGMSGRMIRGKWESKDPGVYTIEGTWSWMNGVSAIDDRRKMIMSISPSCEFQNLREGQSRLMGQKDSYKCYFVIDELTKLSSKK